MKILVTGSTSMQANLESHRRSSNFMGLLWETMRDSRHEVYWLEPSLAWTRVDLRQYDHVFVGISSPMAMGANRIYGAMGVIEQLWGSNKLTLVIDAPDPDLITRGLRAIDYNWSSFTKPFFSYRQGYNLALEPAHNGRLRDATQHLLTGKWPRTIVPGLPWSDPARIEVNLPAGAAGRLQTVNLDYLLLERFASARSDVTKLRQWSYEKSADQKWLSSLNLGLPVFEVKANHRKETDTAAATQLRESMGLLVGPVRGDVWWTPKIAIALSQHTPVFTDWHRSQTLGLAWANLPGPHELRDHGQVVELAQAQYDSYVNAIPDHTEGLQALCEAAVKTARYKKVAS